MFQRLRDRLSRRGRMRPQRPWPPASDRPRVLIEYPEARSPSVLASVLDRAGYEPLICESSADARYPCRLLTDDECELAAGADVIFNGLSLGEEKHQEVIRALRSHHPDTPLVVEASRPAAAKHADLLEGCTRCRTSLTSKLLVEVVDEASGRDREAATTF